MRGSSFRPVHRQNRRFLSSNGLIIAHLALTTLHPWPPSASLTVGSLKRMAPYFSLIFGLTRTMALFLTLRLVTLTPIRLYPFIDPHLHHRKHSTPLGKGPRESLTSVVTSSGKIANDFLNFLIIYDNSNTTPSPGFLDIQINGAYGFDFSIYDDDQSYTNGLKMVSERIVETGVTRQVLPRGLPSSRYYC